MPEYIEREALVQRLDASPLFSNIRDGGFFIKDGVLDIVQKQPAADVVEVVRCKDCKYQEDCARQMVQTTRDYVLEQNISTYNKVEYCSFGAKMDGKDLK